MGAQNGADAGGLARTASDADGIMEQPTSHRDQWSLSGLGVMEVAELSRRALDLILGATQTAGNDVLYVCDLAWACDVALRVPEGIRDRGLWNRIAQLQHRRVRGSASRTLDRLAARASHSIQNEVVETYITEVRRWGVAQLDQYLEAHPNGAAHRECFVWHVMHQYDITGEPADAEPQVAEFARLQLAGARTPLTEGDLAHLRAAGLTAEAVAAIGTNILHELHHAAELAPWPSVVGLISGTSVPASWHPDPVNRSELRYWNGSKWTGWVMLNGERLWDPL